MRIGIGIFIFGMVLGLIHGAVRDLGLFPEAYGKMIFLAVIAAGMLTLGAGFIFPTKKYTKRKPVTSVADTDFSLETAPLTASLAAARTNENDIAFAKDDREFEKLPAASVTEHTTRNFDQRRD
jgi:hypothetical protein